MKYLQEMLDILAEQNCKIEKTKYGAIIITPSVKRASEELNEAIEFKKGGFVYHSEIRGIEKYEWVAIVDYIYGARIFDVCNMLINTGGLSMQEDTPTAFCKSKQARPATHEEKQLLIDTLHKKRKIWNSETLQIEEDRAPRVGDKCVMWHDGNKAVIVSELRLITLSNVKEYHSDEYGIYTRCVRFEDFDFETMKPKP